MGEMNLKTIIGSVIGIVVSVSMIAVINTGVVSANLTGIQLVLANLIPVAFIAGILYNAVKTFM